MSAFSATDHRFMARALELARRGWYTAHPNPRVGCVLAAGERVVGEGFHRAAGEAHAEINALAAAGDAARGATAYVTLEPCAHHGRTGPCADALIDAGVARVVSAIADPHPSVSGRGHEKLRAAGIAVETGLMAAAAHAVNAGFVSRLTLGRPRVRLKLAASLDGRTGMADGESRWITAAPARRDVHRLRAASGAILTGSGTVRADDPSLTVRDVPGVERQPLRAVVDSRLAVSPAARLFGQAGETVLYCVDDGNRAPLEAAGTAVVRVPAEDGRADLAAVLADLGARGVNDVLVEAGPALAGALLAAGLADELVIYQSPHIMGSETLGLAATPGWRKLADRLTLEVLDRRQVGPDTRIVALPRRQAEE